MNTGATLTERSRYAWRSAVFAPIGDGQGRRRASDGLRVAGALAILACCWLVTGVNSHLERSVAAFLTPSPLGVRWAVTAVYIAGSVGVMAIIALAALLSRRSEFVRDVGASALVAWGICELLQLTLGMHGGRPSIRALHGFDVSFPLSLISATFATVQSAMPYVSRSWQRMARLLVVLLALATVVHRSGLPVSVAASLAVGWGVAAGLHLVFGSPIGLPSSDDVVRLLDDLGVSVTDLVPSQHQVWGAVRFHGSDATGRLDVTVYGRDAVDAQFLSKFFRFFVYRDSGPTLTLTRSQQVEHEAYLTLMAGRSGIRCPEVLAAGSAGPTRDALLITRPPEGTRLTDFGDDVGLLDNDTLESLFAQLLMLRAAGIAHGAISGDTIVVGADGSIGLTDFRSATQGGSTDRFDSDIAACLAAVALTCGAERAIRAAAAVLSVEDLSHSLPRLQRAAMDPVSSKSLQGHKALLDELRTRGAEVTGVEVPKLAETRRISGMNLVLVVGSLIGGYALIGVLLNVTRSFSTIRGADVGWVIGAFILAQLTYPALSFVTIGSTGTSLAYGRVLAVEVANSFVALAIPMGPLAMRVRFFQKQGSDATNAVSSGAVASSVSWVVKGLLFVISIPLAAGTLMIGREGGSGGHSHLVWLLAIILLIAAVAVGAGFMVPRLRRLARAKLAPTLNDIWNQLKLLLTQPRKLLQMFGGAVAAQLLIALCLGASLHAFGDHLSLPTIIVILTTASILGGVSPVPGGMGVVEAGMILGLTAAGLSQTDAVAVTFIQRLVTAYLPPIWGWITLVAIRRRDLI
jgi:uncharacterized protein (TIRG00374 family)